MTVTTSRLKQEQIMITQPTIEEKLAAAFKPAFLEVINESYQHNVPAGSESHFKVVIVSDDFEGKRLIQRHRAVNQVLSDELANAIHALAIHTLTPSEWEQKHQSVPVSPDCLGGSKK